ncbi:hypothetical protein J4E91_005160 [Alternaria rosae]|nr:hypothetical protein J4E91_005160 [Alternaria rosae]
MAANDDSARRDSVNSYVSSPQTPQGALGRHQTQSPYDPSMVFPLQAQLPTPKRSPQMMAEYTQRQAMSALSQPRSNSMQASSATRDKTQTRQQMSPQMMAEYMHRQAMSTLSQPRSTTMQAQSPRREEIQARQHRKFLVFATDYFQRLSPQSKQQFNQLPSKKQHEIVKNALVQRERQLIQKAHEQHLAQQQAKEQAVQQAHFSNFVQQFLNSLSPEQSQRFRQVPELQQKQHIRNVYNQKMQNAQQLHQQRMQQTQQHQLAGQLQQVSQPQQLGQQPQRMQQSPEVQQHQEPQPQRIQQTKPAPQLKRPRSDDSEAGPATKVAKVSQPATEQQPKKPRGHPRKALPTPTPGTAAKEVVDLTQAEQTAPRAEVAIKQHVAQPPVPQSRHMGVTMADIENGPATQEFMTNYLYELDSRRQATVQRIARSPHVPLYTDNTMDTDHAKALGLPTHFSMAAVKKKVMDPNYDMSLPSLGHNNGGSSEATREGESKVDSAVTDNTESPDEQRLTSELTSYLASKQAEEEAQMSEQSAELLWQMQNAGPYPGYSPAKSYTSDN